MTSLQEYEVAYPTGLLLRNMEEYKAGNVPKQIFELKLRPSFE